MLQTGQQISYIWTKFFPGLKPENLKILNKTDSVTSSGSINHRHIFFFASPSNNHIHGALNSPGWAAEQIIIIYDQLGAEDALKLRCQILMPHVFWPPYIYYYYCTQDLLKQHIFSIITHLCLIVNLEFYFKRHY